MERDGDGNGDCAMKSTTEKGMTLFEMLVALVGLAIAAMVVIGSYACWHFVAKLW